MSATLLAPLPMFIRLRAMPTRLWQRVRRHAEIVASRRQLAGMDARMLKDIGLSHAQAVYEASRQPWDVAPRR